MDLKNLRFGKFVHRSALEQFWTLLIVDRFNLYHAAVCQNFYCDSRRSLATLYTFCIGLTKIAPFVPS